MASLAKADLAAAQAMMGTALFDLGSLTQVTLDRTGTEEINGNPTTSNSRLAIQRTPVTGGVLTQLEYRIWKAGKLQTRIVAEVKAAGPTAYERHLWVYDAVRNTYSSWSYGKLPIESADLSMLRTVKKLVSGHDVLLIQLAEEAEMAAQSGENAAAQRWRPFMPLSQVTTSGGSIQAVSSVGSRYHQTDYTIGEPNPDEFHLNRVDIYSEQPFATTNLTLRSTITVNELTLMTGTSFTFDPGNARPVSNAILQGS